MWALFEYDSVFTVFMAQWAGPQHKKRRGRIMWVINRLKTDGNMLRGDFVDNLGEGIFELRVPHDNQTFRFLFFYMPGKRIYFVLCFEKKTRKTPADLIDLAAKRKRDIELDEALANAVTAH